MFRMAINELVAWKNSSNRKPMIIRGTRAVCLSIRLQILKAAQ